MPFSFVSAWRHASVISAALCFINILFSSGDTPRNQWLVMLDALLGFVDEVACKIWHFMGKMCLEMNTRRLCLF